MIAKAWEIFHKDPQWIILFIYLQLPGNLGCYRNSSYICEVGIILAIIALGLESISWSRCHQRKLSVRGSSHTIFHWQKNLYQIFRSNVRQKIHPIGPFLIFVEFGCSQGKVFDIFLLKCSSLWKTLKHLLSLMFFQFLRNQTFQSF